MRRLVSRQAGAPWPAPGAKSAAEARRTVPYDATARPDHDPGAQQSPARAVPTRSHPESRPCRPAPSRALVLLRALGHGLRILAQSATRSSPSKRDPPSALPSLVRFVAHARRRLAASGHRARASPPELVAGFIRRSSSGGERLPTDRSDARPRLFVEAGSVRVRAPACSQTLTDESAVRRPWKWISIPRRP